jgi:hypothetical protein
MAGLFPNYIISTGADGGQRCQELSLAACVGEGLFAFYQLALDRHDLGGGS